MSAVAFEILIVCAIIVGAALCVWPSEDPSSYEQTGDE